MKSREDKKLKKAKLELADFVLDILSIRDRNPKMECPVGYLENNIISYAITLDLYTIPKQKNNK